MKLSISNNGQILFWLSEGTFWYSDSIQSKSECYFNWNPLSDLVMFIVTRDGTVLFNAGNLFFLTNSITKTTTLELVKTPIVINLGY